MHGTGVKQAARWNTFKLKQLLTAALLPRRLSSNRVLDIASQFLSYVLCCGSSVKHQKMLTGSSLVPLDDVYACRHNKWLVTWLCGASAVHSSSNDMDSTAAPGRLALMCCAGNNAAGRHYCTAGSAVHRRHDCPTEHRPVVAQQLEVCMLLSGVLQQQQHRNIQLLHFMDCTGCILAACAPRHILCTS
jgi:hypothetical protein